MAKKTIKMGVQYDVKGAGKVEGSFKDIGNEANNTDKQVGNLNKNVKQTSTLLKKLKSVAGFVGVTSGIALLGTAVRSAFNNIRDFSKANSSLAAVLQKSKSEIKQLTDQQKQLGATTEFSASQIANAQIELAKMGFTMEEIGNTTKGTLSLASSAGVGLSEAAEVLSATLRGFGLDASESGRVTDIMATSFVKSSLDMEKFRESMKLVAPIAKAANIDIETTTALLGQLANNGLAGSIAGTGLKNLMSKLSNESSSLSKELGFSVKNSDDLVKAFNELKKGNIDLTKATELTDERSKAAFLTLINGIDSVEQLTEALKESEGAAAKLAEAKLDNIAGDITKLGSAWEGLTLQGSEAETTMRSAVQGIIKAIEFLTKNFNDIVKVVASATLAFVGYKAGVAAARIATAAYTLTQGASTVATALFSNGLKGARAAMVALNTATKMNPFGLILSAITAVLPFLGFFKDGVDEGTKSINEQKIAELERQAVFEQNNDKLDGLYKTRDKLSKESLIKLKQDLETSTGTLEESLLTSENIISIYEERVNRLEAIENKSFKQRTELAEAQVKLLQASRPDSEEERIAEREREVLERRKEQIVEVTRLLNIKNVVKKEELGLIEKLKQEIKELTEIREKSGEKEEVLGLTKKINLKQKELALLTKIKEKEKKDKTPKETELQKSIQRIAKMEDDAHLRSIENQRERNEEELLMAQEHAIKMVNLTKLTEEQKQNEINVINDYYNGLRKEEDKKFFSEEKEQKIIQTAENLQQVVDSASDIFNARNEFNQEAIDIESSILEEQFRNKEISEEEYTAEKQRLLNEQHQMDKRAAVQKLAIDTANSLGGLMNYAMNNPMNSVTSGLAGVATYAAGAIQIATQAASVSKLLKSSAPTVDVDSTAPDTRQTAPNIEFDGVSAGTESFGTQIPIIRAYVTESDITTAQDTASDIEGLSSIG